MAFVIDITELINVFLKINGLSMVLLIVIKGLPRHLNTFVELEDKFMIGPFRFSPCVTLHVLFISVSKALNYILRK